MSHCGAFSFIGKDHLVFMIKYIKLLALLPGCSDDWEIQPGLGVIVFWRNFAMATGFNHYPVYNRPAEGYLSAGGIRHV